MIFRKTLWIGLTKNDLLNNILRKSLVFKASVKISKLTEEILRKSLVINEEKRFSWEELFSLFALKEFKDEKLKDFEI